MRRFKFGEIVLLVVVIFAILCSPILMGYWVEGNYRQLIAFYNAQGNFHFTIQSYKKDWLGAHASISVDAFQFSKPLHFRLDQDIHYGPIIFPKNPEQSHLVEMAFIHGEIYLTPDTDKFIQALDPKQTFLQLNDDVSFRGIHKIHFHARGFEMAFEEPKKEMGMENLTGIVSIIA